MCYFMYSLSVGLSITTIEAQEDDTLRRRIRKALEIQCQAPSLRHSRYEFSAIYLDILSREFHDPKLCEKAQKYFHCENILTVCTQE